MALSKEAQEFKNTLREQEPDNAWSNSLKALWWDAKGDWNRAHDLVDGYGTSDANAVHAYLHRKEGDTWNANYWYDKAQKPFFKGALESEWQALLEEFLP